MDLLVFFCHCWNFVGANVCEAVCSFFQTGHVFGGLNSSFIILIPKVPGANSVDKFRPIILSNFIFKIITKILANRLASFIGNIVAPSQYGFIRGRHIEDCIVAASENVNLLNVKCLGGNMAMKVDIRKAFDSMDWDFVMCVLHHFGFSDKFCGWILSIF